MKFPTFSREKKLFHTFATGKTPKPDKMLLSKNVGFWRKTFQIRFIVFDLKIEIKILQYRYQRGGNMKIYPPVREKKS